MANLFPMCESALQPSHCGQPVSPSSTTERERAQKQVGEREITCVGDRVLKSVGA